MIVQADRLGLKQNATQPFLQHPLYQGPGNNPYLSSSLVLSRSDRENMAERGKSSASSVAMKLVTLLLMQMTSLARLRSLGSSHTCNSNA